MNKDNDPDRVIVPDRKNIDIIMDVFRFLATLQLPDHPKAVQRELRDRCSELGRAIRAWEHKKHAPPVGELPPQGSKGVEIPSTSPGQSGVMAKEPKPAKISDAIYGFMGQCRSLYGPLRCVRVSGHNGSHCNQSIDQDVGCRPMYWP